MTAPPTLKLIHFFGPGAAGAPAPKEILGGKGHSLAEMTHAGLPVPPGFTISAACCKAYAEAGRKWPEGLEAEIREALAWLERAMDRTFGQGPRPLLVAVRSGAAVSMPGMMDTVLNCGLHSGLRDCHPGFDKDFEDFTRAWGEIVGGAPPTDPWAMLSAAVNAVFNSWESERAVQYRRKNAITGLLGTAVTVMAMFPSQRSGILFTADPNRPESGRLVIEASTGLGEAIVRGHVEPDVYHVDRSTRAIVDRRLFTSCLTDAEVFEIAELGLKVEAHFGAAMDIEWGLADGRLALLQSRPIRGLDVARALPRVRQEEIERLRGRGKAAWAIHNLAETLPAPTPLTWDIMSRSLMTAGFARLYRDLGFVPSERVARDGFLDLIGGRIYADLERSAELFLAGFPMEYDVTADGRSSELLLGRPTRFIIERAGLGFLLKLPYYAWKMIRAARLQRRLEKDCIDAFQHDALAAFDEALGGEKGIPLDEPSRALHALATRVAFTLEVFGPESLKPGFLAAAFHGRLLSTLEMALGPDEGRAFAARLLGGLEGDKTVESNIDLWRVAKGEKTLEAFLAEHGHRAVNELELSVPRWREDPSYLEQRVKQLARGGVSPLELHERKKEERRAAEESISRILRDAGASSLEEEVRADLAGAQRHMPWRETCKHHLMRGVAAIREAAEALGRAWGIGRDVYFLRLDELDRFASERDRLLAAIPERRLRWQACQRLEMPQVITSGDLEAIGREAPVAAARDGVFEGTGVAAGIGTGPARLVESPDQAGDLGTGYVLVCPTTDPSWTPLFLHAAGLVVERGGMLSHGAIVARDFGIPAVVLPNARRLIRDGIGVRVDGNRGRVEVAAKA
jgi:pyruvate,water dikinase